MLEPTIKLSNGQTEIETGCCVAHRASAMISDLHQLYDFGIRYRLLPREDGEIKKGLELVEQRFGQMAKNCVNCA